MVWLTSWLFPVLYFSSCLAWTNGSLPSTLDHFTEYQHWQCIGVLLGTSLAYGCNIRELWGTNDDGFCPPFNLGGRFNLARDQYLSWRRYLNLWPSDHSDDNLWYMAHSLIHAFNQRCREGCGTWDWVYYWWIYGDVEAFFLRIPPKLFHLYAELQENLKALEWSIRT